MSVTAKTATPAVQHSARPTVWKHGIAASVTAALVVTALAAVAKEAGVAFAGPDGASIPLLGFTQLTLIFSLVGVAIAAVMARRAGRPRRTFVRTTAALTVLSLVPDAVVGFDLASALTLMTLHVCAALVVVPVLARRLTTAR